MSNCASVVSTIWVAATSRPALATTTSTGRPAAFRVVGEPLEVGDVARVPPDAGHSRAERGDGVGDLVLEWRGHDNVGAFGDEPRCDGTTDAGGAGGDDREAALQESHQSSSSAW